MKTPPAPPPSLRQRGRNGSALITTVLLMLLAGLTLSSILTATLSYTRICEKHFAFNRAAFLADAGLQASLAKLNAAGEANISYNSSRGYFNQTSSFTAPDWGFQTTTVVSNSHNIIQSQGRYNGVIVQVQAEVSLGAGNRSIHALYAHAMFAGNSGGDTNYALLVGGTGTGADFVKGDAYSGGNITVTGDAKLRLPEILNDLDGNGIWTTNETWQEAYVSMISSSPVSQVTYDAYVASKSALPTWLYSGEDFILGELFVDTIGNGVYDLGEPFTDTNGNGTKDPGDSYIDKNGNGVYDAGVDTVVDIGDGQYDAGEEWVEDTNSTRKTYRKNGRWDAAGGYWKNGVWKTSYSKKGKTYSCSSWPAEQYSDVGDGVYQAAEAYVDQNGVYDSGEQYFSDRNGTYDYGTQAAGTITGMPSPSTGQRASTGGDPAISPPDLSHMYYNLPRSGAEPADALSRWGFDVIVTATNYGSSVAITTTNKPQHIFVRNPPTSGSVSSGGKTIYGRSYTKVYDTSGNRIDDYFFEDPADSTYNTSVSGDSIDGTSQTAPMYINVTNTDNVKLYYVDGNVYIHHPQVYAMRFRNPGTRITIVASGNITISDEFYYNADYDPNLTSGQINSTIVNNPSDALCLIALKNPNCPTNSGNIYIGDKQFGTGGSIHAMLYAENNFIDNNLNTASQPYISIYGNMSAGNKITINRSGSSRTRLDVTLDERIRNGTIIIPGLPHPVGFERSIIIDTAWQIVPGTWSSWSQLK